jgi:hypothetical protein
VRCKVRDQCDLWAAAGRRPPRGPGVDRPLASQEPLAPARGRASPPPGVRATGGARRAQLSPRKAAGDAAGGAHGGRRRVERRRRRRAARRAAADGAAAGATGAARARNAPQPTRLRLRSRLAPPPTGPHPRLPPPAPATRPPRRSAAAPAAAPGGAPPAATMATRNPNLTNTVAAAKRAAAAAAAGGALAAAEAELRGPRGEWWWTGRKPWECPGFDSVAGVLRCGPVAGAELGRRGRAGSGRRGGGGRWRGAAARAG